MISFPDAATEHPVLIHSYTNEPLAFDKVVSFWGSVTHDGTKAGSLQIYVTLIEQFPWANLDAKCSTALNQPILTGSLDSNYMVHIPLGCPLMVITQGQVEEDMLNWVFVLAGKVYRVCPFVMTMC